MRRPHNSKKSPTCFDERAVFAQYRQNKFANFVAFSENLNFNDIGILVWFRVRILSEHTDIFRIVFILNHND